MQRPYKPMMTRPCDTCPFRKDVRMHLEPGRTDEIVDSLLDGDAFPCHNTIDHDGHEDGTEDRSKRKHCAGAARLLLAMGEPNTWMQIAGRLGLWDGTIESPVEMCLTREEFRKQATCKVSTR